MKKPTSNMRPVYHGSICDGVIKFMRPSAPFLMTCLLAQRGREISSAAQLRSDLARICDIHVSYSAVWRALKRHPELFDRFNPLQNGTVCYSLNACARMAGSQSIAV